MLGPDGIRYRVSCLGDLDGIAAKEAAKPVAAAAAKTTVSAKDAAPAGPSRIRRAAASKK